MVFITPLICWVAHLPVLAKVNACVFAGGAFVSLYLLLGPFLYQHRDFCVGPLAVLQVLLLLSDC